MANATAQQKLIVTDKDLVDNLPPETKAQSAPLTSKIYETQITLEHCDRYRGIVNYGYWEMRCEAEQTVDAVAARKHVYQALEKLNKKYDPIAAKQEFELAWGKWSNVFKEFPELMDDVTGENLNESIDKYEQVLLQMGSNGLPPDFPLKELRNRKTSQRVQQSPSQSITPSSPQIEVREIPLPGQPPKSGPPKE